MARALFPLEFTLDVEHCKGVLGATMPGLIPKPKRMLVALNKWRKLLHDFDFFAVHLFFLTLCVRIGSFTNVAKRTPRKNLA